MREQRFKNLEAYPKKYPIYYNNPFAGPNTLCLSFDHRKRRALIKYVSAYGVNVKDVIPFGSLEDYALLQELVGHRIARNLEFAPENLSYFRTQELAIRLNLSDEVVWQRISRCRDHFLKATQRKWSVIPKANELIETHPMGKDGYRIAPDVRIFEPPSPIYSPDRGG